MDKIVFFTVLIGVYIVFYRTEFVLLLYLIINNLKNHLKTTKLWKNVLFVLKKLNILN